jgi:hypothetical protein
MFAGLDRRRRIPAARRPPMCRLACDPGPGGRCARERRGGAGARPGRVRWQCLRSRQAPRQGRAGELLGDLVCALPQGDADARRVLPPLPCAGAGNDRHQRRLCARSRKSAQDGEDGQLSGRAHHRNLGQRFGTPEGVPVTYVIDADGIVRDRFIATPNKLLHDVVIPLLSHTGERGRAGAAVSKPQARNRVRGVTPASAATPG